ncbi:hypothetical protein BCT63_05295 [Vibrio kanaloae]|nr:hypothetical protein BCT63_05295 [Vibrio kanaloae]
MEYKSLFFNYLIKILIRAIAYYIDDYHSFQIIFLILIRAAFLIRFDFELTLNNNELIVKLSGIICRYQLKQYPLLFIININHKLNTHRQNI